MLPKAARIPHAMTLHGDTRIDNYYWLRDDTRSQPEVLDYLQQENSYGHRVMASQQALQDRILKEIIDRIPQREVSAPYIKNGYRYRHIYEPGCEYAIYQRQSAFSEEWDEWETLLDANKRAAHSGKSRSHLPRQSWVQRYPAVPGTSYQFPDYENECRTGVGKENLLPAP